MSMQVLTTDKQMRDAIRRVLAPAHGNRIAVVAFVGADAEAFLPDPRGITIYCWPKAGGTNPHAIGHLKRAGAVVHFVERLHMKLFSSTGGGTVVGSANLTQNALGNGGLIECGVFIDHSLVEIRAIVSRLVIVADFEARLRRLHEEHVHYYQRNPLPVSGRRKLLPKLPFPRWYAGGRARQPWRLGWYLEDVAAPTDSTTALEAESGTAEHYRFVGAAKRSDMHPDLFTLSVQIGGSDRHVKIGRPSWWIPEVCIKSAEKDWADYPFIWFAQNRPPRGLRSPFDEGDPVFVEALRRTISAIGGIDAVEDEPTVPRPALLRQLNASYAAAADEIRGKRPRNRYDA
jgi:hypothetical protein